MKQKLKIGLVLDDYFVPYWIYLMVNDIKKNAYVDIVLSINNRRSTKSINLFHKLILQFDRIIFRTKPDVLKPVNIKGIFDKDILQYSIDHAKGVRLTESEIVKVGLANVDVFFLYGSEIFDKRLAGLARFGIWSYTLPESGIVLNTRNVFLEVLKKDTTTSVGLQVFTPETMKAKLLVNSCTSLSELSLNRNLNACLMKASSFVSEKLKGIVDNGNSWYEKQLDESSGSLVYLSNSMPRYLSVLQMAHLLFRWFLRLLQGALNKLIKVKQWVLLYDLAVNSEQPQTVEGFKVLPPPHNKFWADPHIVYKDEKFYIFFEECSVQNEKGVIALMIMEKSGKISKPVTVLEEGYHLSYPFVFEYLGDYYMIPETEQNNSIDLYKCSSFPDKWVFLKTLINDIKAVDATILFKDDLCWLFVNVQRNEGASIHDELFIYYADTILSDNWTSHADNPVVSDVRKARPAGKFFMKNGALFRPAQDCSKRYGYAIKINKVTLLDKNNFQEEEVESIYPDWNKKIIATHTYNREGTLTLIDAQFLHRRFFRKY